MRGVGHMSLRSNPISTRKESPTAPNDEGLSKSASSLGRSFLSSSHSSIPASFSMDPVEMSATPRKEKSNSSRDSLHSSSRPDSDSRDEVRIPMPSNDNDHSLFEGLSGMLETAFHHQQTDSDSNSDTDDADDAPLLGRASRNSDQDSVPDHVVIDMPDDSALDHVVIDIPDDSALDHVVIDMPTEQPTASACHPTELAKTLGIWVTALITSSPTALYAAFGTTSPKDINEQWWHDKSIWEKVLSVTFGFSSETVNTILSGLFIPLAVKGLYNGWANIKANPVETIVSTLGGIVSAFSAIGLAYTPFRPLTGDIGASAFSAFNGLVSFTQRFAGTQRIFQRFSPYTNTHVGEKATLQTNVLDTVSHLTDTYADELQTLLNDALTEAKNNNIESNTDAFMQLVFKKLALKLQELHEQEQIDTLHQSSSSKWDYAKQGLNLIVATASALSVFCTFGQKGFQAFDNIEKIATHQQGHFFADLPVWSKILIGTLPGLVAAGFYFINTLDFAANVGVALHDIKTCWENNEGAELAKKMSIKVGAIGLILALNIFASPSMYGVGLGITKNNFWHIPQVGAHVLGTLYPYANQLAAFLVNLSGCLSKVFTINPASLTAPLVDEAATKRYIEEVVRYFHPVNRPLSDETFEFASSFTLFGGDQTLPKRDATQVASSSMYPVPPRQTRPHPTENTSHTTNNEPTASIGSFTA